MNENSFNVCSRCGGANPLSARYCYQCGYELKSPEAPVVCTKCNTVNQGSANFCKRCGSKLPKAQSKTLCPQCSASNVAGATYCVNCGFDFTTSTMPSALSLAGQVEMQEPVVAASVAPAKEKKLSGREKRKLKREEEERLYREQLEAKKQAKLAKKQAKKQKGKQVVQQPVAQPQVVQYPVVQQGQVAPFVPPVVQQVEAEQPVAKAKSHRLKNLFVFLIALVGLYVILLPQQFNLLKSFDLGLLVYTTESVSAVKMTGWDILIAVLSNFVPSVTSLSTVASNYTFESVAILVVAALLAIVVIYLALVVLAKLLGILTCRARKGVDKKAILMMLITGGAFAYAYFKGVDTIEISLYAVAIPVIFLLVAIFNSKVKKD